MGSHYKRIILVILTLAFGSFSHSALASLDGTFSGPVSADVQCSSPFVPLIAIPGGTYSLQATPATPPFSTVTLSYSDPALDLSYSGTGTAIESGSTFIINVNGTLIVNTGNTSIDGSYSALYSVPAILNPDGSLSLDLGSIFETGQSPCGSLFAETDPTTLFPGGGVAAQVNPEETPSTTITAPLILKTEIQTIVSDLQYRINDVMRAWQLRLKQFSSPRNRRDRGSLSPTGDDGEVVADTRGQDDSQTPVRIQRTGSGLMMNSMSGMNAGDSNYLYGAWGSYSYTDFENDFASTAFDGQRHGGLIGLDVSPWDGVLLGVAVGYEDSDIDTDFNLGNQETDGFTIAPYLGALINDTWSVSASFGYSSLDTDQFRTLGTTTFTSSPDSDRWFAMFNLNGLTTYDNWIIGGQIGVLWARNELDAYTETSSLGATTRVAEMDTKLAQWNIGADVAYSYGEFEPFARVMYENDFSQTEIGVIGGPQPSFDDDDVMLGFGLRYFGANNLTGNLEFNTRLDRDDYDEYDISATIRYDW